MENKCKAEEAKTVIVNEKFNTMTLEQRAQEITDYICNSHLSGCEECAYSSRFGCRCYDSIKQKLSEDYAKEKLGDK